MFTADTRMSDAFAARPELRQLLPAFHPAFKKLEHPVLGKILPRLVNVADAAKVAGVDVDALLAVMNLPGPPAAPQAGAGAHPVEHVDEPTPPWLAHAPVQPLDVRDDIGRGEEPFARIMGALRALKPGHVLTVIAPFEPAPLRRLMGDRGWQSHVTWDGDACRASFWHPPGQASGPAPEAGARLSRTEAGWTLDVRGLEPPEPLRLAVQSLDRGELPLTLLHHREPALLYPKLQERGLQWEVATVDDHVEVRIRGA